MRLAGYATATLTAVVAATAAGCFAAGRTGHHETELTLAAGPFPALPAATLATAIMFENDIDSSQCYPLSISGRVVAYLHRAHRTGGRLFVEPCDVLATSTQVPPGTMYGAVSGTWAEAALNAGTAEPRLTLRPLKLRGWSMFSNPAPCGDRIAYWAFDRDGTQDVNDLKARIATLSEVATITSRSVGAVLLETDNRSCLERPVWDLSCGTATFDARRQGKYVVRLKALDK